MYKLFFLGVAFGLLFTGCEFNKLDQEALTDEVLLVPKLELNQKAKTSGKKDVSPYSCLISTLSDDEAVYNYWNQSFWIHFPKPAIEKANGKTISKAFSYSSEYAGYKAGSWAGEENIVRVAQCVIPDSKMAETLLHEKLKKFGFGTWAESRVKNKSSKGDWECGEYFLTFNCSYNSSTEDYSCTLVSMKCISYVYVYDEDEIGGGGGSGTPSEDPGECDPLGTEPCFNGPGGSEPIPPEPNPCEENDPPAWCQPGNKCETGDPTLDNTGVQEMMEYLYEESDFDLPITQRKEQGGFITKNPISGQIAFVEFPGNWVRSACKIDLPSNWRDAIPINTIAWIHTHPFFEGENTKTVCGSGGEDEWESMASRADWEFLVEIANHLNDNTIKGYVIDGNNIVTFDYLSGVPPYNTTTHSRCGF